MAILDGTTLDATSTVLRENLLDDLPGKLGLRERKQRVDVDHVGCLVSSSPRPRPESRR